MQSLTGMCSWRIIFNAIYAIENHRIECVYKERQRYKITPIPTTERRRSLVKEFPVIITELLPNSNVSNRVEIRYGQLAPYSLLIESLNVAFRGSLGGVIHETTPPGFVPVFGANEGSILELEDVVSGDALIPLPPARNPPQVGLVLLGLAPEPRSHFAQRQRLSEVFSHVSAEGDGSLRKGSQALLLRGEADAYSRVLGGAMGGAGRVQRWSLGRLGARREGIGSRKIKKTGEKQK